MPSNAECPPRFHGNGLARRLLGWIGWRLVFDGLPSRQGVLVLYPHTSNWDFPIALLAKWAIGLDVTFWGKDTLFRIPLLGRWLRYLGGVPVLRHASQGAVGQMTARMLQACSADEFLWLALSPEGTRARTDGWRSGFYRVAVAAGVPLALAFIDYPSRRIGVCAVLRLSGQADDDMAAIAAHLAHHRGRRPALAAPIRLKGDPT